MALQHLMIESPTFNRRQPLLSPTGRDEKEIEKETDKGKRIGEVAGGTAAECAVVCCCCPCMLMHLLVLAVYKIPTGLCKKALKKNKRKRLLKKKKKKSLEENQRVKTYGPGAIAYRNDSDDESDGEDDDDDDNERDKGMVGVMDPVALDSEMWDKFYGAGFWRSFSRRDD